MPNHIDHLSGSEVTHLRSTLLHKILKKNEFRLSSGMTNFSLTWSIFMQKVYPLI